MADGSRHVRVEAVVECQVAVPGHRFACIARARSVCAM
jgi:hypothetical protein